MNYSADRPINKSEDDLLGRESFSKYLGKAIYRYNGSDGLVIGLFGKWGTGKTSIINMAKEEIKKQSENNENKPIIIDFSPWNYSDKNDLISLFFQSLKSKFDLEGNILSKVVSSVPFIGKFLNSKLVLKGKEKSKQEIGEALSNYADVLDALSFVPLVGPGLAKWLKAVAKAKGNNLMKTPDLDTAKENLEKKLKENNQKIIIVIDDIDRLANTQIRDIFQLVKQVADFPNIIYILSMDREVVSRALEEVHKIDGNQYLEKIIQLPFEILELSKSKLKSIFLSKLDKIIKELPHNVIWDEDYWDNIFRNCIEPYIKTLRDVNRVINTFSFRYGMSYEETCFEDMVAITTIEVLEPKLYKWIVNNKDLLCRGLKDKAMVMKWDQDEYRKKCKDEFTKNNIDAEKAFKCIYAIFPKFEVDIGKYKVAKNTYYKTNDNIRGNMRMAYEGRFDFYIAPGVDDVKVSRKTINEFIYESDYKNLKNTIIKQYSEENNEEKLHYFVGEIRCLIDKIPYERLGLIASVLLCIRVEFKEKHNISFSELSSYGALENCVYDILKRLETSKERSDIIKSTLENISDSELGVIAGTIIRIEDSYGRLTGTLKNEEDQIISEDDLLEIENKYINKINEIIKDKDYPDSILEIYGFQMAFYLWKCLDKDGAKKYISDIFKYDLKKLRFICSMAWRWDGTKYNGWGFNSELYSEYIQDEDINNLIQDYAKKNLDKFSELEQIKLASFVLNYYIKDMKYGSNEEQAAKLVEEWKQSQ